jgi:hypothetical protein
MGRFVQKTILLPDIKPQGSRGMQKRKVLFTAIAAAGLCAGASQALAGSPTPVGDICGTTIAKDTDDYVNCGYGFETLTENCNVKLEKGANLNLNQCNVDADGYSVEFKGEKNARISFNGNGSISDASKIVVNMTGYENGCVGNVVYLDNYDLQATGSDGLIDIKVSCGDIWVYLDYSNIYGEKYVNLQADKGNVYVSGNPSFSQYLRSEASGVLSLKGGGGGQVTVDEVNLEAGTILLTSGGGTSFVGDD